MHRDRNHKQFRLWLRPESVQQLKLLALVLGRDDWNQVADDAIRVGVAYINEAAKLELADWKDTMKLFDLRRDLGLKILKGDLPLPEST